MYNNHEQEWQHYSNYGKQLQQQEGGGVAPQQEEEQKQLKFQGGSTSIMEYSPGYRFCPSDEELIMYYLRPKIANCPLPFDGILTLDINKHSPTSIKDAYKGSKLFKENEMYLFTPRLRKYANGTRPDRTAEKGYWKPTGNDKNITDGSQIIGYKKQLDFYTGIQQNGKRTSWKMHEYRINQAGPAPNKNANGEMNMQLDRCVLCKVYLSKREKSNGDIGNSDCRDDRDTKEPNLNVDDRSQTVQANESFVQNQDNDLVISSTSTATTFPLSSTFDPNSFVQMYSDCGDDRDAGEPKVNIDDRGQTIRASESFAQNQNNNLVILRTSTASTLPLLFTFDPNSVVQMYSDCEDDRDAGEPKVNVDGRVQTIRANEYFGQNQNNNLVIPGTSTASTFPLSSIFDPNGFMQTYSDCGDDQDAGELKVNVDDRGQTIQANESFAQNQNNNLVISSASTTSTFPLSSTFDPSSFVSMYGETNSFIDEEIGQTAQINNMVNPTFERPLACNSAQTFDQSYFITNQSSGKRNFVNYVGDSIMNSHNCGLQTVQINEVADQNMVSLATRTSRAFAGPLSHNLSSDQSSTFFIGQNLQIFDENNSSFVHQSLQKKSCGRQEDARNFIMATNNLYQSAGNNDSVGVVPSIPCASARLVSHKPSSSSEMFGQNSSLMNLKTDFNN